jgi:putative Mg2+ transporter-C (MgtC) family protein
MTAIARLGSANHGETGMDITLEQIFPHLGDPGHVVRVMVRLSAAAVVGAIIGYERQHEGKQAGLRTHMLVALGAAMFTMIPGEAKMDTPDVSRVIQGVATGVGFLGAGCILHVNQEQRVKGLTTAASIWVTAAAGMATGAGYLFPAIFCVVLAWTILSTIHHFENWWHRRHKPTSRDDPPQPLE